MTIALFSTYLNHHQLPLCEAFWQITEGNFLYVSTSPISKARLELGYRNMDYEYPFVVRSYESAESRQNAMQTALESDIVIFGSAPEYYVSLRMKTNKLTFRYSERVYKDGVWRVISPRGLKNMIKMHTHYRNKELYMLCASAYAAHDFNLIGAYKKKTYKWGYFPEVKMIDIDQLIKKRRDHKKTRLLWAGRFLSWKHAEAAVALAEMLKKQEYDFELHFVGNGELEENIRNLIDEKSLSNYAFMHGAISPEEVREQMEQSDIFLFTSDFHEGWGAVLNEAMNSGCALIASHAIGSVPFLIKDGENGYIYKNGDMKSMFEKVKRVMDDLELRERISRKAYQTMSEIWNAKSAAERFIVLSKDLLVGKKADLFSDGPCSRASVLSNNWYVRKN